MISNKIWLGNNHAKQSETLKNWSFRIYMFVWTSALQKLLVHTDFNMFVDEWMSANESPAWNFSENTEKS